jgi:hypothetical protein
MLIPKVENMESPRSGSPVANQFIITFGSVEVFQSYSTIIATRDPHNGVVLDKDAWNYSVTTGKYRNIFLNENKKETQAKIDNGTYKLADLNEN